MIITHATSQKIEEITDFHTLIDCYRGCLFFGGEGNTYSLTGCVYQYNLEVDEDKIIDVTRFFYRHDSESETVRDVMDDMIIDLGLEDGCYEIAESILEDSTDVYDYIDQDCGTASWLVQQYQGILAHRLGYDAAEAIDEQGTVYISYCVGKKLNEVTL